MGHYAWARAQPPRPGRFCFGPARARAQLPMTCPVALSPVRRHVLGRIFCPFPGCPENYASRARLRWIHTAM